MNVYNLKIVLYIVIYIVYIYCYIYSVIYIKTINLENLLRIVKTKTEQILIQHHSNNYIIQKTSRVFRMEFYRCDVNLLKRVNFLFRMTCSKIFPHMKL